MTTYRPMPRWRKDLGLVLPSVALLLIVFPLLIITSSLQRRQDGMSATSGHVEERYREWARDISAGRSQPDRSRLISAVQIETSLRVDAHEQYRNVLQVLQVLTLLVAAMAILQVVRVHRPFRRWRKRRGSSK